MIDKKKQTNKITRLPDTNIPESTWEYKITNNNNIYMYIYSYILLIKEFIQTSGSSNLLLDKI